METCTGSGWAGHRNMYSSPFAAVRCTGQLNGGLRCDVLLFGGMRAIAALPDTGTDANCGARGSCADSCTAPHPTHAAPVQLKQLPCIVAG
jgi:hypothetical protein